MIINHKESPQELRAAAYPDIGDQLDAVFKLAESLHEQGLKLPAEVVHWIDQCRGVKNKFPKDGL